MRYLSDWSTMLQIDDDDNQVREVKIRLGKMSVTILLTDADRLRLIDMLTGARSGLEVHTVVVTGQFPANQSGGWVTVDCEVLGLRKVT